MKFVSALNRKLFHISDHRVVRQLVESLTEVALKLFTHETSIRDLVEKFPVVRFCLHSREVHLLDGAGFPLHRYSCSEGTCGWSTNTFEGEN